VQGERIPLLAVGDEGSRADVDPAMFALDLPEMAFDTKNTSVLGLNVTMQCPLRCDFCCYSCNPTRTERMPLDLALDLVDQGAALGVFSSAAFTGGEPFLWWDELLATGDRLREVGMRFSVVTAAHWASERAVAEEMVGALVDRGIYRLCMSTDPSHARFVPPAFVVNAALAAAEHGLEIQVAGAFDDPDMTLETFVPELVGLPNSRLATRVVGTVGRGRKGARGRDVDVPLDALRCYRPVDHDFIVFWDGDVYPCCSVYNRDTEGIKVGNAYEDSVQVLWERMEGSLLLRTMKRAGFQHLYSVLEELDPALARRLPPLDPTRGACRLCNQVFSDLDLARDIRNAFVAYEQRTVDALLTSLQDEFGAGEAVDIVRSAIASDGRSTS